MQNQCRHQTGEQEGSESSHDHQAYALAAKRAELDRFDRAAFQTNVQYACLAKRARSIALVLRKLIERNRVVWGDRTSPTELCQETTFALELTRDGQAGESNRNERCRRE